MKFSLDSSDGGGAILLRTLSAANITRCLFRSNRASGDGGAIYVVVRSKLEIFGSEFILNSAENGGSFAVYMSDSFTESCSFTSSKASRDGGCIHLKAANVTIKQSTSSGCESDYRGGSMYLVQQSTLRIENVKINDSYSRQYGGAIYVHSNSELFMTRSVITRSSAEQHAGIRCETTSRVYLESVLISSCSSSIYYGCVYSWKCNVTMDNITVTDTDYAITVLESSINIINSLALNDTIKFVRAESSDVTFWNMNISGAHIVLEQSAAEFRHTVFMTPDKICPIKDIFRSNITLKSVYIPHTANRSQSESGPVCKGIGTVLHGNTSGKNVTLN